MEPRNSTFVCEAVGSAIELTALSLRRGVGKTPMHKGSMMVEGVKVNFPSALKQITFSSKPFSYQAI